MKEREMLERERKREKLLYLEAFETFRSLCTPFDSKKSSSLTLNSLFPLITKYTCTVICHLQIFNLNL